MKRKLSFALAVAAAIAVAVVPGWSADANTPAPVFSDSSQLFNPYLPLTTLSQDILAGVRGNHSEQVVRTRLQGTKEFVINGQVVQALIMEDDGYEDGQLIEIAKDYFVEADDGTVYYMGEDVDIYKNGQIIGHTGAWLYGADTTFLGTLMPGHPKVGQKWMSENIPNLNIVEHDSAVSTTATITVPAGTFHNCVETLEQVKKEGSENKWYCPSVGVVMEFTSATDYVALVSHTSNWTLP
jgi:hypothetical protein